MATSRSTTNCRGVTLVELLVVLAIIGILAAALIPTIAGSIRRAKIARMAVELNQLAQAMEAYKAKFNDYPPDFTNALAVQRHVKIAFPRANIDLNPSSPTSWWNVYPWQGSVPAGYCDPKKLDPAEALVFWLSAIKTSARDPLNIDNVHPNTAYVIDGPGDPVSFFTFDPTRLTDVDDDGWPEYSPADAPGAPYVYFDGRLENGVYFYGSEQPTGSGAFTCAYQGGGNIGTARPYRSNSTIDARDNGKTYPASSPGNDTTWIEPGKFQIICAGLDENYGSDVIVAGALIFKKFPDINYPMTNEDSDNLTSFSSGRTIGDSVP